MSDEAVPDEAVLNAGRLEVAKALGRYADGWSTTEGGIVTAFVALAEVASPDGEKLFMEMAATGDGSPSIPSWLRLGMLHQALRQDEA